MKRRDFLRRSSALAGLMVPWELRAGADDAQADWLARASAPGVIWAHDFRQDAEVARFLSGNIDKRASGVFPRRSTDGPTGGSLEFILLGAQLTEDFGLSSTVLRINDSTNWPEKDFYFHLCKPTKDEQNNLFHCKSRSGNALTVEYVPMSGQPFLGQRRAWLAGDVAGHECVLNWVRPFSALTKGDNGLAVDDRAEGVRLRSKTKGNPRYAPHYGTFGYGWYGRKEYQEKFATWTPTYDKIARKDLWDGDEFYLQFRVKIDPRFWEFHVVDPNSEDNRWGHKLWMLQAESTVPQQITAGISPSNRYQIPSTRPNPFALAGYSFNGGLASRLLTNDLMDNVGVSTYQPGSPWAGSAKTGSFKPAGSAWEYVDDEWLTFLLRIKPGLDWLQGDNTTARNTAIEVKVARQGKPYETLFSVTDQAIVYGSSGPIEHDWRSALPGYNAFVPTGYLNVELGNVPPIRSYYQRFTQVIFSKQSIAAPAS